MNLKDYCKKEKITLKTLSKAMGYNYLYFASQVRGLRRFTFQTAKDISEYCNGEVTVEELLPMQHPIRCSDPRCNRVLDKKYWKK